MINKALVIDLDEKPHFTTAVKTVDLDIIGCFAVFQQHFFHHHTGWNILIMTLAVDLIKILSQPAIGQHSQFIEAGLTFIKNQFVITAAVIGLNNKCIRQCLIHLLS
ncbi:hypothetical protein D3C72_2159140 [compost metagenome]